VAGTRTCATAALCALLTQPSCACAQLHGQDIYHRTFTPAAPGGGLPLLVLHGGPGVPHDYLLPLSRHASASRAARTVAFYDQPGCGRSSAPARDAAPPGLYSVPGAVALVGDVVRRLRADAPATWARGYHLLGQSWGGVLALEFVLAAAADAALLPASVVLANTPADIPALHAEVARLMAAMPLDVVETMRVHEGAGTTDDPAYKAAVAAFYARHQCMLQPRPECLEAALARGGSAWRGTGVIADWSAPGGAQLAAAWPSKPPLPALLVSGEHDFVTPACVAPLAERIPGASWALLRGASHMPHLEIPEAFDAAVVPFWSAAEVERA
jgi:proline-specific peptidase